jgi:RND family efflux transporter MFP subunit
MKLPFWSIVAAATSVAPAIRAQDPPRVTVAEVVRQDLAEPLEIQAEFRAYQEVELHPKVAGFLQKITVDFGDRVKVGELIAVLEVPELAEDLRHAAAARQRAEADYKNAHLDFGRLQDVLRTQPNLVAQQDLDSAEAKDSIAAASLAEANADMAKYQTMVDYTHITAPFSGVVTQRYADPGALIQAGTASSTQAQPLIRLSQLDRLRLDFPVSVTYATEVGVGDPVNIAVAAGERALTGRIARVTHRISMDTRTMEAEVEVPNPDLALIPGMYATVTLNVQRRPGALSIPVDAVIGSDHPRVYVVGPNRQIVERAVTLGLETPTRFEVLSGLKAGEQVVVAGRAEVQPGETVAIQPAPAP